jgi:hypothetical protein
MQGMTTYQGLQNKCICLFNGVVGLCNLELHGSECDFGRQERMRSWPLPRQINEKSEKTRILVSKYECIPAGSVVVLKNLKFYRAGCQGG